jgi:hypothetical protein
MLQGERCPDCGTVSSEWIDEEGRSLEPPPYVVESLKCLGCIAKEEKEGMVPPAQRKGIHFFFRRWRKDDEL